MLNTTIRQSLLCFFLGIAVASIAIFTLGVTMAIAAPVGLFGWFKSQDSLETGLFLWDSTIVFGLGAGLPTFLALFAAFRLSVPPTFRSSLFFLAGFLLTGHVLVPLAIGTPLSLVLSRPWWGYGLELSLIVGVLAALLIARRLRPNNSFKPNPLRHLA